MMNDWEEVKMGSVKASLAMEKVELLAILS